VCTGSDLTAVDGCCNYQVSRMNIGGDPETAFGLFEGLIGILRWNTESQRELPWARLRTHILVRTVDIGRDQLISLPVAYCVRAWLFRRLECLLLRSIYGTAVVRHMVIQARPMSSIQRVLQRPLVSTGQYPSSHDRGEVLPGVEAGR
jgi:hypothetical protein